MYDDIAKQIRIEAERLSEEGTLSKAGATALKCSLESLAYLVACANRKGPIYPIEHQQLVELQLMEPQGRGALFSTLGKEIIAFNLGEVDKSRHSSMAELDQRIDDLANHVRQSKSANWWITTSPEPPKISYPHNPGVWVLTDPSSAARFYSPNLFFAFELSLLKRAKSMGEQISVNDIFGFLKRRHMIGFWNHFYREWAHLFALAAMHPTAEPPLFKCYSPDSPFSAAWINGDRSAPLVFRLFELVLADPCYWDSEHFEVDENEDFENAVYGHPIPEHALRATVIGPVSDVDDGSLTNLALGFGFKNWKIDFKSLDHDEWIAQRGRGEGSRAA